MRLLDKTIKSIAKVDESAKKLAWNHLDNLSKPVRSLGDLEEIVVRISGITGNVSNTIKKKNIVVFCSDNGVCDEGVSGCSQDVTSIVTNNLPSYTTGVGVLARYYNCDITVVDVGVKGDITNNMVINKKIRRGTNNIRKCSAMTREEAIKALEVGIEIIDNLCNDGYDIFGTGEMGIGNTSTSAAIISVLLDIDIKSLVGLGAGLNKGQLENKIKVIEDAISFNRPNKDDVIDVLSKVGGYDIAAMCGSFLSAAKNRVPIVIDGVISCAAALCAYKINPLVKDYMFASHKSTEKAVNEVFKLLNIEPIFDLKMRLGEGSGCPLAISVIESALFMSREMDTFHKAGIDERETENYFKLYKERKEYEKNI